MEYSYKFRIYPNIAQVQQIRRTFGCCRFVWNHYLAQRIEAYRETGKSPTRFMQDKNLTSLKKQEETIWLREVDATALQSSLQDLDIAYQNFFRRVKKGVKPGYPKFKSKRNHRSKAKRCQQIFFSHSITPLHSSSNIYYNFNTQFILFALSERSIIIKSMKEGDFNQPNRQTFKKRI